MAINIGVDVGGTFTDFAVSGPAAGTLYYKLPSTPEKPDQAIIKGLEDLLSNNALEPSGILRFSHGTTVGTNALIQRRVGKVALITTKGFRDLIEIGRQTRPKVYDMHQDFPKPLVPRWLRYEVSERIQANGTIIPLLIGSRWVCKDMPCLLTCRGREEVVRGLSAAACSVLLLTPRIDDTPPDDLSGCHRHQLGER